MGANRQMRRRMQREQMHEWVRTGKAEKVRKLQQNGITQDDLDQYYNDGYREGYDYASTAFFRCMYAAIAKELHEAGNGTDEILSFLRNVDNRVATMFDADAEIDEVYQMLGVRLNISREIDRFEVTENG